MGQQMHASQFDAGTGPQRRLTVSRLKVSAGRIQIVKGVSFEAEAGEVTAIIGPSGSGKTTLMKAMTGEFGYTGQIVFGGANVRTLAPEAQADLRGVLPQASQISFPLNVSEVVGLGTMGPLRKRTEKSQRIAEALAKVGLPGFEGRLYQELSGGEQQRVQLARVLCQVWDPVPADGLPRWLFLDEPVSSLDIKHQYQIMQLVAEYAAAGGGVVAVMHDLNLTAAFAHKVLVMKDGEWLAYGASKDILKSECLSEAYDFPLRAFSWGDAKVPLILPDN